jgi:hypothetical protein
MSETVSTEAARRWGVGEVNAGRGEEEDERSIVEARVDPGISKEEVVEGVREGGEEAEGK